MVRAAEIEKETRREELRKALKAVRDLEDRLGDLTDPREQDLLMEEIEKAQDKAYGAMTRLAEVV